MGILGVVLVPWVAILSVIAALGTKCSIELIKDNGDVVNLSGKATDTFEEVKSNCSVIADDLKEKGGDAFSQVKEKASSVINKMKRDSEEMEDDDYFNFDDFDESVFDDEPEEDGFREKAEDLKESAEKAYDSVRSFASEKADSAADAAGRAAERVSQAVSDAKEKAAETAGEIREKAGAAADAAEDGIEKASDALKQKIDAAGDKFDETIEDYKAKKNRFRFFE